MTGWTRALVRIHDADEFERNVKMYPNIDVARPEEDVYELMLYGFRREDDFLGILERVSFYDAIFVSADDTTNSARGAGLIDRTLSYEVRQEAYCVEDERHNFTFTFNDLELNGEQPDTSNMIHAEHLEPEPSESMKNAEVDFIQEAEEDVSE